MYSLIQLREHYGFSQTNLAIYLSISTSLLKMVEQGKRELPSTAFIKLTHLLTLAFGNQPQSDTANLPPAPDKVAPLIKELNRSIRRFEKMIFKNRMLLGNMQLREQQAIHRLQLASELVTKLEDNEEGRKDKVWLELLELEARKNIARYGQQAQTILQWRTDCYLLSIEQAKKVLASLSIPSI